MAHENAVLNTSDEAAEDLSSDQYRIVVMDATTGKIRRPDAITDIPHGVLQNAPVSGEAAVVMQEGKTKLVLGATLSRGAVVSMEYNSGADAGKAVTIASTSYPVAVLEEGGSEDDVVTAMIRISLIAKA